MIRANIKWLIFLIPLLLFLYFSSEKSSEKKAYVESSSNTIMEAKHLKNHVSKPFPIKNTELKTQVIGKEEVLKKSFSAQFHKAKNNALESDADLILDFVEKFGLPMLIQTSFQNLKTLSSDEADEKSDLKQVREITFLHKLADVLPDSREEIQIMVMEYLKEPLSADYTTKKNQVANKLELLELLVTLNPTEGKLYYSELTPSWKKISYNRLVRGLSSSGLPWQEAVEQAKKL